MIHRSREPEVTGLASLQVQTKAKPESRCLGGESISTSPAVDLPAHCYKTSVIINKYGRFVTSEPPGSQVVLDHPRSVTGLVRPSGIQDAVLRYRHLHKRATLSADTSSRFSSLSKATLNQAVPRAGLSSRMDLPCPGVRSIKPLASSVTTIWCTEGGVT